MPVQGQHETPDAPDGVIAGRCDVGSAQFVVLQQGPARHRRGFLALLDRLLRKFQQPHPHRGHRREAECRSDEECIGIAQVVDGYSCREGPEEGGHGNRQRLGAEVVGAVLGRAIAPHGLVGGHLEHRIERAHQRRHDEKCGQFVPGTSDQCAQRHHGGGQHHRLARAGAVYPAPHAHRNHGGDDPVERRKKSDECGRCAQ